MNRGYVRGHFDRAVSEDGLTWFTAATEGVKADGIDLRMSGANLARFQANPVILYGHNAYGRTNLPIGRSPNVGVEGDRLRAAIEWDEEDEFAQTIRGKVKRGFLNAVSIGFEVLKWENPSQNYWKGGVAVEWELFEISVVPVPMDHKATVESGRSLHDENLRQYVDEQVAKGISDWIDSHLDVRLEEWQSRVLEHGISRMGADKVLASFKFGEGK